MSDYPQPDGTHNSSPVNKALIQEHGSYWQTLDIYLSIRDRRLAISDPIREEAWLFSQPDLPDLPANYPLDHFFQVFLLRFHQLTYRLMRELDDLKTEAGRKDVQRCILEIRECLEWADERFR